MKRLSKLIIVAVLSTGFAANAQDKDYPWSISLGANAVDTRGSAGSSIFDQPFKVKENWNAVPSISYLNINRLIKGGWSVGATGTLNRITKYVYTEPDIHTADPGDLRFYALDAQLKYSFMEMLSSKTIDPFLHAGGGYTWFGANDYATANAGLGFNFWLTEQLGINLATVYKYSFGDRDIADGSAPLEPGYWQHFAGLTFKFGAKDTDKDKIIDKFDKCPDVAGLKEFDGCPDTDGDGIMDKEDKCPDMPGKAEFNGCPDTDGDGIIDIEDACPTVAGSVSMKGCPDSDNDGVADNEDNCPTIVGLKEFGGCPDTDGDGIMDKDDRCPNIPGAKENGGCPWPDLDKDGVPDKDDQCPDIPGTEINKGCPELTGHVQKALDEYAKTILFKSGTDQFEAKTISVLDNMIGIMKEYPNAKFRIEGHTDSTGSPEGNLWLSKQRALAVEKYLEENGIANERLSSEGYGETRPIDSNKTKHGRANNRRVELKLEK